MARKQFNLKCGMELNREFYKDETQKAYTQYKNVHYPQSIGKCKQKNYFDISCYHSWNDQDLKQMAVHAGKNAEKGDHLLLVGVETRAVMKEIFKEVLNILSNWGNEKLKPL